MGLHVLISMCVCCKGRVEDLKVALPTFLVAMNQSPAAELVVLDYDSEDGLETYIKQIIDSKPFVEKNFLTHVKIKNKPYYHMSHAKNCGMLSCSGEVIIFVNADELVGKDIVKIVRSRFDEIKEPFFMCEWEYGCTLAIRKEEFIRSGGYDERFEFYGPEEKDICARLHRRGLRFEVYPKGCVDNKTLYTPIPKKMANYRIKSRRATHVMQSHIFKENIANNVMVANVGVEWGKF